MPVTDDPARAGQLSLDVKPHPALERRRRRGEPTYLQADLETKVSIPIGRDFNPGDEFLVTIADADGQVLGRTRVELRGKGAVRFDTLEERGRVIGTVRIHKATQIEDAGD